VEFNIKKGLGYEQALIPGSQFPPESVGVSNQLNRDSPF
jgi:hypothetical protein